MSNSLPDFSHASFAAIHTMTSLAVFAVLFRGNFVFDWCGVKKFHTAEPFGLSKTPLYMQQRARETGGGINENLPSLLP